MVLGVGVAMLLRPPLWCGDVWLWLWGVGGVRNASGVGWWLVTTMRT
jgi:hypothetical protein